MIFTCVISVNTLLYINLIKLKIVWFFGSQNWGNSCYQAQKKSHRLFICSMGRFSSSCHHVVALYYLFSLCFLIKKGNWKSTTFLTELLFQKANAIFQQPHQRKGEGNRIAWATRGSKWPKLLGSTIKEEAQRDPTATLSQYCCCRPASGDWLGQVLIGPGPVPPM